MAIHMPAASTNNAFDAFARNVSDFSTSIMPIATLSAPGTHAMVDSLAMAENELEISAERATFTRTSAEREAQEPVLLGRLDTNISTHPVNFDSELQGGNQHITPLEDSFTETNPVSTMSEMSLNPEEMKGYAQLVFPDGEYLVTTTEIMLGRDEKAQQILKEQEKRLRREQRELAAQQALQRAADEQGDGHSEILEGRPAPGIPSTFSETGGIVNYEGSVDGMRRKRNKRRSMLLSRSPSTNSVAPASLHVYGAAASPWHSNEDSKCIFLPIHPFQSEDIKKISKEHLRIFYDSVDKHWKMEIKGNGAFVLNELYQEKAIDPDTGIEEPTPRHFQRGDTVILTHNTEVLVTSLTFAFKLPHKRGMSTFDTDDDLRDEDEVHHGSQDSSDDSSDEDDSELETNRAIKVEAQLKRPKITLKATKPAIMEEQVEVPTGMGSKGGKKKPKEPGHTTELVSTAVSVEQPQLPPVFDANSTLQHVPVNELPEKRKGPGRPPKNGLVSKRDEGIIRRKMKEYEKRGERPPPYKDILALVRAENRAKELAAKAAARGEPVPIGQEGLELPPLTDVERLSDVSHLPQTLASTDTVPSIEPADDSLVDPENPDSQLLQPQRTYRSPSPMRPREEYTEEQLKRPTQTYYYILDEILSEDPEDAMELQQIYDKICKKYPFYKYVVESTGWQSSVRHNLKQNERFKPVSKQGKGWLWAIDPAIPLDKEKKKKPTPPPMPRPMHYDHNGVAQPGMPYGDYMQYGQQAYHQPSQAMNGHQVYRSPYSQGNGTAHGAQHTPGSQSTPGQLHGHPQNLPHSSVQQNSMPRTVSQPTSRPASNTPQPTAGAQPGTLPPAFQDLVEEIMRFRVEYLSPYGGDPAAYARHERIFKRCVEWISKLHMRQNPDVKFENEEEQRVFQILEKMRHKFEQGSAAVPQNRVKPPPQQAIQQQQQSSQPLEDGQIVPPSTKTESGIIGTDSAAMHVSQPTHTTDQAVVKQDSSLTATNDTAVAQHDSSAVSDNANGHSSTLVDPLVSPVNPTTQTSATNPDPAIAGAKRQAEEELAPSDDQAKRAKLETD